MLTRKNLVLMFVIAALYYAAGTFGLLFAVEDTSATPLWPPAGIAVAAICTFGWRVLPGVFLGALVANLVHLLELQALSVPVAMAGSVSIALGNSLEALIAWVLFKKLIGENPLDEVQGVFKFVPSVGLACMVASVFGTFTMLALGLEDQTNFASLFVTWWLGDTLAVLIIAPLLMSWWPPKPFLRGERLFELGCAFSMLLLLSEVIFFGHYELVVLNTQPLLLIPVFMWLAIRFGRRELATGVAFICMIAIYATLKQQGPFVADTFTRSFLSAQLFSALVTITMLVLSAAVAKSVRFQHKLQLANEELEQRVLKRTEELEKKTRVLEAINHQLRIEAQGRLTAETQLRDLQHKR